MKKIKKVCKRGIKILNVNYVQPNASIEDNSNSKYSAEFYSYRK